MLGAQPERLGATRIARSPGVRFKLDAAPSAYNEDDPPGALPASPLAPCLEATGFRWAA